MSCYGGKALEYKAVPLPNEEGPETKNLPPLRKLADIVGLSAEMAKKYYEA